MICRLSKQKHFATPLVLFRRCSLCMPPYCLTCHWTALLLLRWLFRPVSQEVGPIFASGLYSFLGQGWEERTRRRSVCQAQRTSE